MDKIVVAIDGPAAAGKSTVAKKVAKVLGCTYIDTGAMYRAITYFALKNNVNPQCEDDVVDLLPKIDLELKSNSKVFLNGQDITQDIRMPNVSQNVSYVASYKAIRLHLVDLQRKMANSKSVVMDGRDIGTYVLPNADVKIFQVASVETRAARRHKENLQHGIKCKLEDIEAELRKRDFIDSSRTFAPLKPAPDSVVLDTSDLTIDEAVQAVLKVIKDKGHDWSKSDE